MKAYKVSEVIKMLEADGWVLVKIIKRNVYEKNYCKCILV
jgi:hypothetical protein